MHSRACSMCRSTEVLSFGVSEGTADAPQALTAPQPLSSVSAIGPRGFAVLTADHQSICFSGWSACLHPPHVVVWCAMRSPSLIEVP